MKRLLRYVFGYGKMVFFEKDSARIFHFLHSKQIEFEGYSEAEGKVCVLYPISFEKEIRVISEKFQVEILSHMGLLPSLKRRLRPGVAVGLLLSLSMLLFSGLFVWEIRIEGNETVDDDKVIAALAEKGFRVGSFLPFTRLDQIENGFLVDSEEIAWLNINMQGCIAVIDLIERDAAKPNPTESTPANLVAATDALVIELALVEGRPTVKRGEVVKKGQLLASGVLEGAHETRFVRASGEVIGRATRVFSVEVPLKNVKKVERERKISRFSINFFGYSLNIFEDDNNLTSGCDIIYKETHLSLFGLVDLPITVSEEYWVFYDEETLLLTEDEARLLASRLLYADMTKALHESELVSKKVEAAFDGEAYRMICKAVYLGNIAERVPIITE